MAMTDVRIIFTDAAIRTGPELVVNETQLHTLLHVDRLNVYDGDNMWHSADVVRRIYNVSDGSLVIVVDD